MRSLPPPATSTEKTVARSRARQGRRRCLRVLCARTSLGAAAMATSATASKASAQASLSPINSELPTFSSTASRRHRLCDT